MKNELKPTLIVDNNNGKCEIIKQEFNDSLKDWYKNATIQAKALLVCRYRNLANTKKEFFNLIKTCEEDLKNSNYDFIDVNDNGLKTKLTIVHKSQREVEEENTIIDWDKAVNFAKEHNFNIPMTERKIIEPEIDKLKLQNETWFIQNLKEYSHIEKSKKTIKTNASIR